MKKFWHWLQAAPSLVWIFVFVGGLIAFIGSIILLFFLLANVEGFASVLMVIIGWFTVGAFGLSASKEKGLQIVIAAAIAFYALMGMAIDQPGNYFLNKPVEKLLCPVNTQLVRGVIVSHPLPERTDITQDFRCVNSRGQTEHHPDMLAIVGIRFVEYVVLAYVMMGIRHLLKK